MYQLLWSTLRLHTWMPNSVFTLGIQFPVGDSGQFSGLFHPHYTIPLNKRMGLCPSEPSLPRVPNTGVGPGAVCSFVCRGFCRQGLFVGSTSTSCKKWEQKPLSLIPEAFGACWPSGHPFQRNSWVLWQKILTRQM